MEFGYEVVLERHERHTSSIPVNVRNLGSLDHQDAAEQQDKVVEYLLSFMQF